VWRSAAVDGHRSALAPPHKLAAAGHRHVIGVAVSPERLRHRRPVLLADRNGLVSMWDTFGLRLRDPLPPDPAHRGVAGIAVLPGPGGGATVMTASRADCNLRVWEPQRDTVALLPLDVRPRCVQYADGTLLIGHDDGLLALSLSASLIEGR
jgi:hypothetical protein